MKKQKPQFSRRLGFESLEERRVMAGNVDVTAINGVVAIAGDAAANDIQLARVSTDAFAVYGRNGTTINRSTTKRKPATQLWFGLWARLVDKFHHRERRRVVFGQHVATRLHLVKQAFTSKRFLVVTRGSARCATSIVFRSLRNRRYIQNS